MDSLHATPRADGTLTLSRCVLEAGRAYRIIPGRGGAPGTLALYAQDGRPLAESARGTLNLDTEAIRALMARRPLGHRIPCVAIYDDGTASRTAIDLRAAPVAP